MTALAEGTQAQATYGYDAASRLTGITQGSTALAFGYDAASRRTSATLPNGIAATYGYDAASEVQFTVTRPPFPFYSAHVSVSP